MTFIDAIILGFVQGLTEFLPISSSGHLVLFQKWVGVVQHSLAFDIAVHVGTLLSIFTIYFKVLRQITFEVLAYPVRRQMTPAVRLFALVFVGSLPTAAIGLTFKDQFETMFSNINLVAVCFFITGLLLFLTEKLRKSEGGMSLKDLSHVENISFSKAAIIGVAQGLAIAPGISRAGSTIATAILLKIERTTAATFSFMLSIPAVLGAACLELRKVDYSNAAEIQILFVGLLASYVFGLLGLWSVLHFVKKGRLQVFSYYLWILAIGVLIL